MKESALNEVDKVEIITLADNYIDLAAGDNSQMVKRAMPLKEGELRNSILAEHGFSALVRTTTGERTRTVIFDFGFSKDAAARNAEALNLDLGETEAAILSHGHIDHFGGLETVAEKIGKKGLDLMTHPVSFRQERIWRVSPEQKIGLPSPDRAKIEEAGFRIVESRDPYPLLQGDALFLGEIPRVTHFEKGHPNTYFVKDGEEVWDPIEDDSGMVMNVSGKGRVLLAGCAHAGIVNTVKHAMKATGIGKVHAVMGGFHLSGAIFEPIIDDTIRALREIEPDFVIPTHCTGRKAVLTFEREMPDAFIVNMAGTTITFDA